MQTREVKTCEDAKQIVEKRGLSHIKVGIFDIDGVLRGKYMSREKFFSALLSISIMCNHPSSPHQSAESAESPTPPVPSGSTSTAVVCGISTKV